MYRTSDFTPATSDQSHRFNTADTGVVRVGEVLARTLSEKYGIPVVHSKAIHDFPSHAHSYTNAARTVRSLLAKYPSIQVVLDVHRDAAENATYVREVGGTQISQVMVVVSKLGETKPSLHPNWQSNMRFAQSLEQTMQALYPGMLRHYPPVSARYNQNLQKNMVLLEFGNYQDDEKYALRSAAMYADVVAMMLDSVRKNSTRTTITPQSLRKTNPVSPTVEQPAPVPEKPVPSQKQPATVKQPTITSNTTVREIVQPTIKKPAPSQKRP
jgi:stage II sporulation protein P